MTMGTKTMEKVTAKAISRRPINRFRPSDRGKTAGVDGKNKT